VFAKERERKIMKKLSITYIIAVCLIAGICHGDERAWTNKKQQINAEYVSCNNGIVKLKTKSGKLYKISLSKLSESDQNFVVKTKGYAVINSHRQEGLKVSLDVRLEKRVSKERLVEIANELHGFKNNKQPRLYIGYLLPGRKLNTGCWATTDFNPTLKVKILGMTKEEAKKISQPKTEKKGKEIIGTWLDKSVQGLEGRITIYKIGNKLFMRKVFKDGSTRNDECVQYKVGKQTRIKKKHDKLGDYFVIDPKGYLWNGDAEGLWGKCKKIK
jgi:hypothetical protein